MSNYLEFGWGCLCLFGSPRPFIHVNTVNFYRADSQKYIGEAWARDNEDWRAGWKRAYRAGWRCIRVSVDWADADPDYRFGLKP